MIRLFSPSDVNGNLPEVNLYQFHNYTYEQWIPVVKRGWWRKYQMLVSKFEFGSSAVVETQKYNKDSDAQTIPHI